MTGRYKSYPEYMNSGVDWLGEVPTSWKVMPCRGVVRNIVEKNEGILDKNYLSLMANVGVIKYEDKGDVGNKKPDDLSKCKIVKKGNLVINSMNYAIGSYGMSEYDGVCSPVYIVLDANGEAVERRFALRVFENKPFQKYLSTFGNGILEHRAAIGWDDIKGAYIAVPSKEEQLAILNFLDHETAKIDTLIEKQQQLIKLLKEKRQAVISHAVTKGLNPNAKMRDSGVEWLGEVPEHWEVTRAKFLFCFVTSGSRGWAEYYSDEGPLFFRIANLTRDTIESRMESTQKVMPPSGSEGVRSKINKGDLLISITADLGSVCVANDEIESGYVSQHVALCRPNENVESSRWLAYFILSDLAKEQFIGSGYGGTKIQLSLEDIRELWIVRPAGKYQIEIASHIDKQMEKFSKLIGFAEEQIILLQERRTALISAAVTGKIDVRDWQSPNG
ncbi:restriction endonuclease subunit S [Nitrosomonas ureae]|uniref:Type I restriction enzyme, S subunit n=1 Tax=Nitrosomonas ureae TaxID=44577 RepID=A0A286A543_9PROT|nr:restriction endonuclease subunit S [Nitrosomonas ureae]SOD16911.1 type I restriction enzyme, S subunit [Nitrosomonas ureae]